MAGMPVGPLSLNDEVAIDLALKIMKATKAQLGEAAVDPEQEELLDAMVETRGPPRPQERQGLLRLSRRAGRSASGRASRTCSRRSSIPTRSTSQELKQRFLVTQALEAARTVEEGIVTDPREADVGSILGFGFAPFTGGTLSYIDFMGAKAFVALCERARRRSTAPASRRRSSLRDMAATRRDILRARRGAKAA